MMGCSCSPRSSSAAARRRRPRPRRLSRLRLTAVVVAVVAAFALLASAAFLAAPPPTTTPSSPSLSFSSRRRTTTASPTTAATVVLFGMRSTIRKHLSSSSGLLSKFPRLRKQQKIRQQQQQQREKEKEEDCVRSATTMTPTTLTTTSEAAAAVSPTTNLPASSLSTAAVATGGGNDDFGAAAAAAAVLVAPPFSVLASSEAPPPPSFPLVSVSSSDNAKTLYELPPVQDGRKLTKLEREYRDILGHFTVYSERDMLSLRDPRMRTLFRGVVAGAQEPAVYRAFEVLFDDLYPLRMAGRLVYRKMRHLMAESERERRRDVDAVVSRTDLDAAEVDEARIAFVSVAAELNGDAYLTVEQLSRTPGLADVARNSLGFESAQELLDRVVECAADVDDGDSSPLREESKRKNAKKGDGKHRLSFVDLALGLNKCAEDVCAVEECNPAAVMHRVMYELREHPPPGQNFELDERRKRFEARYDEMVAAFCEWEDLVPEGEGRRMDVVRGCFVGAKNKPVLDALRVVYVDYGALRIAGDIIFKLVSSVMNGMSNSKKGRRRKDAAADAVANEIDPSL